MAGHSKFANIKHRKGAQDAKRAKLFTKLAKEIIVAAQLGQPDPDFNPRLRQALAVARKAGVPKDRIENSIKKGAGEISGENFEEIRYEGYAAGGIAIIVETLSDNKNRTAAEVRSAFTKQGGSMGETGSVNFMFDRVGCVVYEADAASEEVMFEAALEAGAENCESDEYGHEIICAMEAFNDVSSALEDRFGDPEKSELIWKPKDPMPVEGEQAEKLLKLIDALEDCDDVQAVFGNYDISDEELEKLA